MNLGYIFRHGLSKGRYLPTPGRQFFELPQHRRSLGNFSITDKGVLKKRFPPLRRSSGNFRRRRRKRGVQKAITPPVVNFLSAATPPPHKIIFNLPPTGRHFFGCPPITFPGSATACADMTSMEGVGVEGGMIKT